MGLIVLAGIKSFAQPRELHWLPAKGMSIFLFHFIFTYGEKEFAAARLKHLGSTKGEKNSLWRPREPATSTFSCGLHHTEHRLPLLQSQLLSTPGAAACFEDLLFGWTSLAGLQTGQHFQRSLPILQYQVFSLML